MSKSESIVHRVSPEDKAALVALAREAGVSLTEFMVNKSLGRSVKVKDVIASGGAGISGSVTMPEGAPAGKIIKPIAPPNLKPLHKPKRDPTASCDRCLRVGATEIEKAKCPRCIALRTGKDPLETENAP